MHAVQPVRDPHHAVPLGCYEPRRFGSLEEMEREIMEWSARPDVAEPLSWDPPEPATTVASPSSQDQVRPARR